MPRFQTLRRLSWGDRVLLVEAIGTIRLVRVLVVGLGVQRLQGLLARQSGRAAARDPGDDRSRGRATAVAAVVALAALRVSDDHTCLHRSLALWWILRRRGLNAQLRMGVRKAEATGFEAHAWVDYQATVLNDDPLVASRYTGLSVPPTSGGQWAT